MDYIIRLELLGYTREQAIAIYDFIRCRPNMLEEILTARESVSGIID